MANLVFRYRQVGATSLQLPAFGFGSAHLGELYGKVDEADVKATLDAAWNAGVRFYDTAPWYGRGLSEHRLGAYLRARPRSEFKLTTKVGRTLFRSKDPATFDRAPWTGGLNFEVNFDYTYDGIMRSYAQALQRLAIDTVDALVIHDLDAGFHGDKQAGYEKQLLDSGIKAIQELKASGDIKAYGMGINNDVALETIATQVDLDFCLVAMPYTLLDQASLHRGMANLQKRGISVIIGAPFASGILVTGSGGGAHYAYGKASPEIQAKVQGIEAVCKAHGVALPAAALQFVLAHPIVVSVIPGATKASEITENVASLNAPIPPAFWSDLKAQKLIDAEFSGSDGTLSMAEAIVQSTDTPLISARGISKQFAGVEVLRDVDLDLKRSEIHALLGENGAGKSTFAKILAGVYRPSRGTLALNGTPVEVPNPIVAQRLGITLIHQEPISFPDLSVAENLVLGRTGGSPLGRVPWAQMTRDARRLMELLGVRIDVTRQMRGLSIADQQMVEIARALASDSRLIIMDEPTAPLTPKEVETLFTIARRLRDEDRTIVFISHRLEEVRMLCDRVTVFRDGSKVATETIGNLTDADIIRQMIGRPLKEYMHKTRATIGEVALKVEGLTLPGIFRDISFEVRKGEIVGLGGLVGAGRTDVARAIFGVAPAQSGTVTINGNAVIISEPSQAIDLGLAFVPEDRAAAGIFRTLSVEENITAAIPKQIAPGGIIKRSLEKTLASDSVRKLRIRLASLRQPIGELSGGNQQKAILARWLLTDPSVLILDEPTRGIDIGVKAEFYDMIGELAAGGRAILLISSELPELLALCDRVLVMSEGRLTANLPRAEATQESIMSAAVPRSAMQAVAA